MPGKLPRHPSLQHRQAPLMESLGSCRLPAGSAIIWGEPEPPGPRSPWAVSHGCPHPSLVGCALSRTDAAAALLGEVPALRLTHTVAHGEAGPVSKPQFPQLYREGVGFDHRVPPSCCLGDAFSGGVTWHRDPQRQSCSSGGHPGQAPVVLDSQSLFLSLSGLHQPRPCHHHTAARR